MKHASKKFLCPECKQATRRVGGRLVANGRSQAKGTTATFYGHLCKACFEKRDTYQPKRKTGIGNRYLRLQAQAENR